MFISREVSTGCGPEPPALGGLRSGLRNHMVHSVVDVELEGLVGPWAEHRPLLAPWENGCINPAVCINPLPASKGLQRGEFWCWSGTSLDGQCLQQEPSCPGPLAATS